MQERDERQRREDQTPIPVQARAADEEGEQRCGVRNEQDGGVRLMCERVNENPRHLREYERASEEGAQGKVPSVLAHSYCALRQSHHPHHPLPPLDPRQGTAKDGGLGGISAGRGTDLASPTASRMRLGITARRPKSRPD
jgi:hypothetical protein